jgi:hypothetical protein
MRTLSVALAVLWASAGAAQPPARCDTAMSSLSRASFVECARAGTERYRDQRVALLDGYRRIGRDFPAMGEHWIRVGLLFDGRIEASHPEVLVYVTIGGTPHLLGVAYAAPLLDGERPPDGPAGRDAWHDHSRTIEDETVLPRHHTSDSAADGARLAMLHAWIWSVNPEGTFAADNWAIPYLRLGLTLDTTFSVSAAKALSLATDGGREYVERAIAATGLQPAEAQRVKGVMDRAQAEATSIAQDVRDAAMGEPQSRSLAAIWTGMWAALDEALGAEARRGVALSAIR